MDRLFFISGLPRAGSTLLCNILAQNPRFHTTATSGILEILFAVRNKWDGLTEFRAMPQAQSDAAKRRVLRGILESYFADIDRPVVFDKSRGWLAHIEMAEWVLERKIKILVPVRDIRDILASFEKLWRDTSRKSQIAGEAKNYIQFQSLEGRLDFWARADQPVGLAYNRVRDAIQRGYGDRLHFVRFVQLTANPRQTLREIYAFLGEPWYEHDFDNVEQVTVENDRVHGFDGLHTIRPKVEPVSPQWPTVLGKAAEKYAGLEIWQ